MTTTAPSISTMSPSELARRTPAGRNRYIDFLRVLALLTVVVGHSMMAAVVIRDGELVIGLNGAVWVQVATWGMQVMPIFFIVGGYSNAASWRSSVAKGIGYGDWVRARAHRLLRPTIVFVAAGVALAVAVGLTGLVEPSVLAEATQAIVIPVWFLAVYMLVVAAAPAMLVLHERFRLAVPLVLVAVVVAFDVLGRGLGLTFFGWANFIPVWLAVHQLGFYWHDGSLEKIRRHTTAIAGVLLVAITALTFFGPYPVAMVGVRAADGSNNTPPTVLMVVLALAQLAVALRLEAPAKRMLAKPKVWTAVVASGGIAMTVYLWHMTAMILVIGALWSINASLLGIEPMSTLWFITRPLFLGMVVVALIPFVAAFSSLNRPSPATLINLPTVRAIAGCALAGIGLARFAFFGLYWPSGPLGLPLIGIAALGSGAILLSLRRRQASPMSATS